MLEELPKQLQMELSLVMNKQMFSTVEFFKKNNDRLFLTWIAHVLKPIKFEFRDIVFREGDPANESKILIFIILVYFISKG